MNGGTDLTLVYDHPAEDGGDFGETPNGGDDCEGCDGSGIRCPAIPSCAMDVDINGWVIVERCDSCEIYPNDIAAAHVHFREAKWIVCKNGGAHAVGRGNEASVAAVASQLCKFDDFLKASSESLADTETPSPFVRVPDDLMSSGMLAEDNQRSGRAWG
jgi:hypothetical protein